MTDQQVLQAYATRKDAAAFRHLVDTYQGLVYSAAGRRLARQQDIEDVVQLTFLKLAHAAHTIQHDLAAWLYSTAVNAANDLIRRDSTRRRHEAQAASAHAAAADGDERQALHRLLHLVDEAILKLPPEQQNLVVEHFLRGRSQREMAAELGISQATICRRMENAVRHLRQAMGKDGLGTAPSLLIAALQRIPQLPVPPMLTGQLTKIGLAGAGAKVTTLSVWVASVGGGVKLALAASLVLLVTGGVIIASVKMRPSPASPIAPAALAQEGARPQPILSPPPPPPPSPPAPQSPPLPPALIARIREAYSSLEPYATTITSTRTGGTTETLFFLRYATDGRRFDLTTDQFTQREGVLHHENALREIWDGELFLSRASPDKNALDPSLTFSRDPRSRFHLQSARQLGPYLAGFLQNRPVADILETATTRPPEAVQLGDAPCQLIAGTSALGSFQVWIDDRTGLLRKAVLTQKAGDLYWDEPLPRDIPGNDALVACHLEIADIRIQRLGERWVPLYGTCTETLTYRTRVPQVTVETAERSEFRHRPDFAALHAFQMDGISEGQPVTPAPTIGPPAPFDFTLYRWQNGTVVPVSATTTQPAAR